MLAALFLLANAATGTPHIDTSPELGKAEARCRPGESGPALLIDVTGFKDRKGRIKAELYPANDADFLADDNILIMAGKTFRRVEVDVPQQGPVELCMRIPGPGTYSLSVLHDRDSNHKFGLTVDGVGFAGNPKLHWRQPHAGEARLVAGPGITRVPIALNYWRGFGLGVLHHPGD